jgi:beta-fructofuranosidase
MFHLQGSSGWMNDPCAPGFDPTTGLYHLYFQWNPRRNVYGKVAWGTIGWGRATSKDLVHWTVSGATSLKPGPWYDREGCFTGCMLPTGVDGSNGPLTILYTGVSRLPLHYTLPYVPQSETLNIAQSWDHGQTWGKYQSNPILPEPPAGLAVSGWRDPYVTPWPSMDTVLGISPDENALYGVLSGGLKDRSPTMFLYSVNRHNLAQWAFISALNDLGLNHNISRWSGDMGINWECANFMTLTNGNDSREFIVVGGEGSKHPHPESTFTQYPHSRTSFPRLERSLQWMSGTLHAVQAPEGQKIPKMEYQIGGRFDHGCLYAVNTFKDPVTSKHIAWGWITEEDLPQKLVDRQNWSGMISLPRELSLICLRGVTGALVSNLKDITSIEVELESESTCTVRTLGISPASHLDILRESTRELVISKPRLLTPTSDYSLDVQTCRFELAANFEVSPTCSRIGLSIFHSEDRDPLQATTIYLTTETETLTIQRPDSSHIDPDIHFFPESAPFTLFNFRRSGRDVRENLELRAWFDESAFEVFANDRCTFTTRIYPASKKCWGIRFWAEDASEQSKLLRAKAWDGLRADIRVL